MPVRAWVWVRPPKYLTVSRKQRQQRQQTQATAFRMNANCFTFLTRVVRAILGVLEKRGWGARERTDMSELYIWTICRSLHQHTHRNRIRLLLVAAICCSTAIVFYRSHSFFVVVVRGALFWNWAQFARFMGMLGIVFSAVAQCAFLTLVKTVAHIQKCKKRFVVVGRSVGRFGHSFYKTLQIDLSPENKKTFPTFLIF